MPASCETRFDDGRRLGMDNNNMDMGGGMGWMDGWTRMDGRSGWMNCIDNVLRNFGSQGRSRGGVYVYVYEGCM